MNQFFRFAFLVWTIIIAGNMLYSQHQYFDFSQSLRIDFMLTGGKNTQNADLLRLKQEKYWSSPNNSLIWEFNYGTYRIDIYNSKNKLIFRRGFSTLFEEWQRTNLPKKGTDAFEQSINIPMPRQKIRAVLHARQNGEFETVAQWKIDPENQSFESTPAASTPQLIHGKGDYKKSLDLAFLADGYTENETKKARKDANRFAQYLLNQPPFDEYRQYINIWLLQPDSQESGTDQPCKNIYRNTALGSSFNTLELERYLFSEKYFKLKDAAAAAPYDFLLVMVNTKRYGGGGIFNHLSVFSADGVAAEQVFLHEFGHHFAGLADEYFNSKVAYEDMLDTTIEPWQPNITTCVNFEKKWQPMLGLETPVPTPRTKQYRGKVGVFEGGAYMDKGVYSPAMNCRMRSNSAPEFCKVCQEAIRKMLTQYIKKQ